MAKKLYLISSILTLGVICTSCGTYAGVGRDFQKMGRNMEDSENRHPLWFLKFKKKSPNQNAQPNTQIPAPTDIPTPEPQAADAYPSYPEYPEDPVN